MNHQHVSLFQANHCPCPLPDDLSAKEALTSLVDNVETREPRLRGHGARTAWYALQLGRAIHLSPQDLEHLIYAAYLHDVGKLSIPQEILHKEEPLTSQEYHRLQSHPRAAIALLKPWTFLEIPSIWIAHHHERWDGSGYPNGLKGAFIPLGSRIIAIADTYDVLTIRNSGEPESDSEACLSILRWYSGSHFDPEILKTFSRLTPEWVGSKTNYQHQHTFSSIPFPFHPSHPQNPSTIRHPPAVFSVPDHENKMEGFAVGKIRNPIA